MLIVAQIVDISFTTIQKYYDVFNIKIFKIVKRLVNIEKKKIAQNITNVKEALINQKNKIDF